MSSFRWGIIAHFTIRDSKVTDRELRQALFLDSPVLLFSFLFLPVVCWGLTLTLIILGCHTEIPWWRASFYTPYKRGDKILCYKPNCMKISVETEPSTSKGPRPPTTIYTYDVQIFWSLCPPPFYIYCTYRDCAISLVFNQFLLTTRVHRLARIT